MAANSVLAIVSAMMLFAAPSALAQLPLNPQRNVLDRVYTEVQAERGAAQYEAHCMKCHEGNDPDGPSLLSDFIERWREDSLGNLFSFIKTSMPRDEPGTLSENDYIDILTYLLQVNGYAAGANRLTAAEVAGIRLVGKNGPQPLPSNALIRVVGCLTQDSANVWTLTKAAEPVRIRRAEEATPDEVNASAAIALGAHTFRLQNVKGVGGTNPESHVGHRVQAKGVLTRQGAVERINVLILEMLAPKC